ncbi:unnamed protein product, partial [Prorocentrum cordatum]
LEAPGGWGGACAQGACRRPPSTAGPGPGQGTGERLAAQTSPPTQPKAPPRRRRDARALARADGAVAQANQRRGLRWAERRCGRQLPGARGAREAGRPGRRGGAPGGAGTLHGIRRWTTMVAWGGLLGVALPPWYRRLDVWFGPGMNPLKLLFHQFMMSPIFNTCFLSYIETMRELPLDTAPQRVQRRLEADLVPLTSRSFPFWIVVNTMNLYCIPQQLRTVTMSCVNCGWTAKHLPS